MVWVLYKDASYRLLLKLFRYVSLHGVLGADPGPSGEIISLECLGICQEELESVAKGRKVWIDLLNLSTATMMSEEINE